MSRPKAIVVSDPRLGQILPDAAEALTKRGHCVVSMTQEEFCGAPARAHLDSVAALVGVNFRFDGHLMGRMPRLRAIVSGVVGVDTIDVGEAFRRGIRVANCPAAETAESLAEATVLLILSLLYRLKDNETALRTQAPRPARPIGRMLKGKTLGLVGFGPTARCVARRLHDWGVSVIAYSEARDAGGVDFVEFVSLDELLKSSDIVSVHAALNARTANLLSAERLRQMKRGALFVNTARGGIVDELALEKAVREGAIGAVALDTFRIEPLPMDSPLRTLETAVLTPHMIGHTMESLDALTRMAVENIEAVLRGGEPRYPVPPERSTAAWDKRR